ncbi:hypothetical protein AB3S75_014266 [Citrus x aurantiifolia]
MDQLKPTPANSCPLTPLGFIQRAAIAYDDCPSIIYNDTTHTWSQTYRRCLQLASSLSSFGINPGHLVSVIAPNIPAMYELHSAVPMSGAIFNTIKTRLDARTISIILKHSESKLVFVDHLSSSLLLEVVSLFPPHSKTPKLVLVTDDKEISSSSSPPPRIPPVDFVDTYENMLAKGDPQFSWVRPKSDLDPMVLNYTSGTTSAPKVVVQCYKAFFIIAVDSLIDWVVRKQSVLLWTLLMGHVSQQWMELHLGCSRCWRNKCLSP